MTGNPRRHLQNKTYPSLSICFSENLNGKKVAICLLTKWVLPCLTIKYQIQNGGGVGCAPAGAGFSLKLYGDVIILPSQSIPSQSWVQGVRSLLSLLAADEDFSMDLLPFDRFVCMCKCTMNCTVAALQPPLPFTHYKKLNEIFQPQFFQLQCSPFIEKKKKKPVQKYTGPCCESPSHPWQRGLLEESGVLGELLHHKGTETHQLQEFISTICQAFVHFLQREQRRENPLKRVMLKVAVSWGTIENRKFASCFLNQHRFLQQPHHTSLQLEWEP